MHDRFSYTFSMAGKVLCRFSHGADREVFINQSSHVPLHFFLAVSVLGTKDVSGTDETGKETRDRQISCRRCCCRKVNGKCSVNRHIEVQARCWNVVHKSHSAGPISEASTWERDSQAGNDGPLNNDRNQQYCAVTGRIAPSLRRAECHVQAILGGR